MINPDYADAIALIDLADNSDAITAVLRALGAAFKPKEKKALWAMLTPVQRAKLKG